MNRFPALALLATASSMILRAADDASTSGSPSAKRQVIKIQGFEFEVPAPYAVGHVLNENEANTLNQTFAENIRNNGAGRIKSAKEAAEKAGTTFSLDTAIDQGEGQPAKTLRQIIADYADNYTFGARVARNVEPADPVEREAKRIATDAVKSALASKNVKLKDLPEGKFAEMVATYSKNDKVLAEAKRAVKARGAIGLEELGLTDADLQVSSEPTTEGETESGAAAETVAE